MVGLLRYDGGLRRFALSTEQIECFQHAADANCRAGFCLSGYGYGCLLFRRLALSGTTAGFVELCKGLMVAGATFCGMGRRDFEGIACASGAVVGEEMWTWVVGGGGVINDTFFVGPALCDRWVFEATRRTIPATTTPATANRAVRLTERTLAATAKKLVTGTVPPTDCRGSFESVARYADDAIEALIPRLPHFAHSASADGGDDFARAESVSCGVRHGMILLSLSDREAIAPV